MLRSRLPALFSCVFFACLAGGRAHADPLSDLANSSVFPPVDLSSLSGGKVLTAHGPTLNFPRDLSVQAVFLVHAPPARTLDMLKNWNAEKHPELKVYLHHDFSTHPTLADFTVSIPENSATRKLAAATEKLPNLTDLQISKGEAGQFKNSGGGGSFPPAVRDFWSHVLLGRATAFLQRGPSGEPPYDSSAGSARVAEEIGRLIREQPKVRAAFRPLIDKSPLGGGAGSLPLAPYWEVFDAEGQAAFSLGAVCSTQSGDSIQYLDLEYYASGGYYAYVALYQLWPVTVSSKPATLVWRVDSISTLSVADLGPFDRMGSATAMRREIERIINFFQRDAGQ